MEACAKSGSRSEITENMRVDLHLWQLIQEGDSQAFDDLMRKYLPMVRKIAASWYQKKTCYVEYDDLHQEACMGLMRAIQKYDSDQSSFSNYARMWITATVRRFIHLHDKTVRISLHQTDKLLRSRAKGTLHDDTCPESEAIRATDISVISIDPSWEFGGVLPDVADPESDCHSDEKMAELAEFRVDCETIRAVLSQLSERERHIIDCRFWLDLTLVETGEELAHRRVTDKKLSRERVRQIECELLTKRLPRLICKKSFE